MRIEVREWIRAAEDDLEDAMVLLEAGRFAAAAFHAHQAVEKALKASIIALKGELSPRIHNLIYLARVLDIKDENILDALRRLNPHYRISRYPDAAIGVPMDMYSESIALELINEAKSVLE